MTEKPITVGTVQTFDMATGQPVGPPRPGFQLVPPAPGKCPFCAVAHGAETPHNAQSLYYQMRFHGEHGRWPTWADAVAHCAPAVRAAWETELRERGHWTEPADGAAPVSQPGEAAP